MQKHNHVLLVLAHPDDETNLSGTLAKHLHNGTPVTYVCLTLGEMGRNMGNPIFANRVTLPKLRKKELEESCRSIGIGDLRMWGYHDKMVEFEDQDLLAKRIKATIEELDPSLIITFYPGYSVHPDHEACGRAVIRAVESIPESERPIVHCVAFSKGCQEILGPPDVVNEVVEFFDQKKGSFYAHKSQFQLMVGKRSFNDKELKERWRKEYYWTYPFN